jgi:hypothetical protein
VNKCQPTNRACCPPLPGTYTVEYLPTESGDYTVNVSLHDGPIKDMPKQVHVKPCPANGQVRHHY